MPREHLLQSAQPGHGLPLVRLLRPFQEFTQSQAAGGVLLLLCTVVALVWANSPWGESYVRIWQTPLHISLGPWQLAKPLFLWINEALMAVFFFLMGLEIKRELLVGELASFRQALLPIIAALGGMLMPALLYLAYNANTPGATGWGIPVATDIAFALGALALLGQRIPSGLYVFLAALAIADDIGAVLLIAFLYTSHLVWSALLLGMALLGLLLLANALGLRHPLVYSLLGVGLWLACEESGLHATLAGVLAAMTIPVRAHINTQEFLAWGRTLLRIFEEGGSAGEAVLLNSTRQGAIQGLVTACEQVEAPLQRFEHLAHPWVTLAIMPVFALANAGVRLEGDIWAAVTHSVSLGIILGLVLGKQTGIMLCVYLAVRSGMAVLPSGVTWRHLYGVSWLAGMGFTMALFLADLSFGETPLRSAAKAGTLVASLLAGVGGWCLLRSGQPGAQPGQSA